MNTVFIKNKSCNSGRSSTFILSLLMLFIIEYGFSQNKLLTLDQALQTAEANYPAIKAKMMYTKSAEQNLKETKREYIPALKLSGQINYGTANSVTGTFFPYGIVVPTSGGISGENNYNGVYGAIAMSYLEWAPFSFGQYKAKVNESKIQLDYANADATQEIFYNKISASQAYFNLLVFHELRMAQDNNVKRAEVIKKIVTEVTKNGLRPGVDSSFANAELSRAKLELLDAIKGEYEGQKQLADMMGISYQEFTLDTNLFLNKMPVIKIDQTNQNISNHPLIKLYDTRIQLSQSKEVVILRNYFPKISLLGVTNGRGSGIASNGTYDQSFSSGTSLTQFNYAGAVACTFNIMDYPRMKAELNAEKMKTEATKAEYDEQSIKLKNELLLADEKLKLAIARSKETPIQYASAMDTYKQKLAMYNSGLSTLLDVAQSLYNLNKAEADLAVTYNNVWNALLYKAATTGDINLLLNSTK